MSRRPSDRCVSHVAAWIAATGRQVRPDRDQVRRFLDWLEPGGRGFAFRTFSETAYTRLPGSDPLETALLGTLDDCWDRLLQLNRAGAAVSVTVNASNGRGRAPQDMVRVRALFVDDDHPPAGRPPFPVAPQVTVESSPGRFHHYWRVHELPLERFGPLQRRLAEVYGCDHRVFAVNQSMSLPGFWRRKHSRLLVQARLRTLRDGPALSPAQIDRLTMALAAPPRPR